MKHPRTSPLSREITVTLAVKLALLLVLWLLFFSPAANHAPHAKDVGSAILGAGPSAPNTNTTDRNP